VKSELVIIKMLNCRINIGKNAKLIVNVNKDWEYKLSGVSEGIIGDLREEGVYHILITMKYNSNNSCNIVNIAANMKIAEYSLEYECLDKDFFFHLTGELCLPTDVFCIPKQLNVAIALEEARIQEYTAFTHVSEQQWKQALAQYIDIMLLLKKIWKAMNTDLYIPSLFVYIIFTGD